MDVQQKIECIKNSICSINDYPKPGIIFRDITTLLSNPSAFKMTIELIIDHYKDQIFDKIVATEARGFIFGAPIAIALNIGFVPVRKPKKLPRDVYQEQYELEYGTDTLEIHQDAIQKGDRVLLIDDLLATGGTVLATKNLVERCGGIVKDAAFVVNLVDLPGQKKLTDSGINCFSVVTF